MSMALLITILFVVSLALLIADYAQTRSLQSLGLAFLVGALLLIST
jgi:hypothetical protein